MADISRMVVRDAHVSDFGAVVTMHENQYGVMDYMPTLFPQILQDPRSNCFVAVLDGTPIAFCCMYVNTSDRQMTSTGTRVHPDYRGVGVARRLIAACTAATLRRHPGVTLYTWSAFHTPPVDSRLEKDDMRLCVTLKAVGFKGTFDDFARTALELDKVKGDINVLSFNNTRTSSLLTKNSVMQSLFKSRYIEGFANYLPLKVTADNIKRLVLTHKVFCTMGPGDEDCVAASFGLAVKLIFGLTYYFYYHSASHSFDDLLAHHRKHSQHLVSLSRGNHSKNVAFFSVIPIQYGTPGQLEDLRAVLGERAEVLFNEEEIIVESDLSLNNVMFTSNL